MTRFERETWHVVAGAGLPVFDTPLGRIGVLICYDSEFPLLARRMVEQGAEVLLVPSCTDSLAGFTACGWAPWRAPSKISASRCRPRQSGWPHGAPAVDENVGAAAIYGPPDHGFPPTGILAETALNQPGWALAEVDLAAIHAVRRDGGVLNHLHWPEQQRQALTLSLAPVFSAKTSHGGAGV